MTGNEKPQGQAEKTRMGGREVLIGLSRRDVTSLYLALRQVREYIADGGLVTPTGLTKIERLMAGALPEEEMIRWLLAGRLARGVYAGS